MLHALNTKYAGVCLFGYRLGVFGAWYGAHGSAGWAWLWCRFLCVCLGQSGIVQDPSGKSLGLTLDFFQNK